MPWPGPGSPTETERGLGTQVSEDAKAGPSRLTWMTIRYVCMALVPLDTVESPSDPNNAVALVTNAWSSSSRVIGLLIDDLHIDARRTEKARNAARHLIANLAPSDLLYVGLTSTPGIATAGFVRDRRRALEIVESFAGIRLPDPTLELRQTPQTFSNPQLQGMRTPGLAASEQQRAMRLEDAYQAIARIANAVREVGGRRKSLVFLTEGSSVGGSITTSASMSGDTTGAMNDDRREHPRSPPHDRDGRPHHHRHAAAPGTRRSSAMPRSARPTAHEERDRASSHG